MKKVITISCLLILGSVNGFSQRVGIGTTTPTELLDVNGVMQSIGLKLKTAGQLELGAGASGKELNAGKICYGCFGNPHKLNIVGGGARADLQDRSIIFWAEGGSTFAGNILPSADNGLTLGNLQNRWRSLWADSLQVNYLAFTGSNMRLKNKRPLTWVLSGAHPETDFLEIGYAGISPATGSLAYLGGPSNRFYMVYTVAGVSQTSDSTLKTNIEQLPYGLNEVLKMNAISYNWKTNPDDNKRIGFNAQEMANIIPEAVEAPATPDAKLAINYAEIVPVLVNAVKEQQAQIEALKAEVKSLKKKRR